MPVHPLASLEAIGFDDERRDAVAALGDQLTPARVTRIDRGAATLSTPDGDVRAPTRPDDDLAVGDLVVLDPQGSVAHVLERRGAIRRLVGNRFETLQVVAANVDLVLIVRPLDLASSPRRILSLISLGYDSGAVPVIVLTKADLVADPYKEVDDLASLAPGVEVVVTSVVTGEGIDRVRELIADRTSVFLGESGGGKSTLTNRLVGADVLSVQATRADGQGRHTTSHRELIALPEGGAIIDTPGVREVVAALSRDQVDAGFGEITDLATRCRFRDCAHGTEPGCAVAGALDDGSLARERFEAYEAALRDAAWNERRADKAARAAQRKAWRAIERQRRVDSW